MNQIEQSRSKFNKERIALPLVLTPATHSFNFQGTNIC